MRDIGKVGSIAQPGGVWVRAVVLNWGGFAPRGSLAMSWDSWGCHVWELILASSG